MFTSLPWKPFSALRVNGCFGMSRKEKTTTLFFYWSVCTLYMLYHHFMNFWRKLSATLAHWELVSPSCGNSEAAMSGDTVISLGGVLSGGLRLRDDTWRWLFCYIPAGLLLRCVYEWAGDMKTGPKWLVLSKDEATMTVSTESKRSEKQNVALKLSPSEASVSRWDFFFLSNTNTVLWLSGGSISIFRWCSGI